MTVHEKIPHSCRCKQENKHTQTKPKNKTKIRRDGSHEIGHCDCGSAIRAAHAKINTRGRNLDSIDSIKSSQESFQEYHSKILKIKWAYPLYTWSWTTIKKVMYGAYILNGVCIFYSFILFIVALQMELTIADFLNMVTRDDGYAILITLGVSSFLCFLLNSSLLYVTWRSRIQRRNHFINTLHFALIWVGVVLVIMLISLGIACGVYPRYSKQDDLHNGITKAMGMYRNDSRIKRRIDIMQITFQCCGSKCYSEWFNIPWYDNSVDSTESDHTCRDDAPFSCCNRQSCYPCIHHDLMSVGSTYLYAPETNLSITERGCFHVLLRHTRDIAWRVCIAVVFLAFLELIIIIIQRFLQTAHVELYRYERNFHWHSAWLFGAYKRRERAGKSAPKPPPIPYELMK